MRSGKPVNLFEKSVCYLIFRNFSDDFSVGEYHADPIASGDSDICIGSFTRSIDHATHDGNLERLLNRF